jgi:protein O-GlcNAc transferase
MNETATLDSARALHQAGRWQEAEAAYRRMLDADPRNVEALHLLGALLSQMGHFAAAVAVMERALQCRPADPVLWNNLGNALKDAGRLADAEKSYRESLKRLPGFAHAHCGLGHLLHLRGNLAEAERALNDALAINARHPYAHNYLGMVLADSGRLKEAAESFRQALAIHPDFAQAHHNLGLVQFELGQGEEAERSYRRALALAPHVGAIHSDLGDTLAAYGHPDEAQRCYRHALDLDPRFAPAHAGMGNVLRAHGKFGESEASLRRALELDPHLARAHNDLAVTLFQTQRAEEAEHHCARAIAIQPGLGAAHANRGTALTLLGRLTEAEGSFRRALELRPDLFSERSALLFLLNHLPGRPPEQIFEEHREFGRRVRHLAVTSRHANSPNAERRLRIGYVSADLRDHSVGFFIEPVLASHDRNEFEVTCYYNHSRPDATTHRLKSHVAQWRDVWTLSDDALAAVIREDAIDILVDLSGHTANHRLLAFARKPAPVQVTWLGYLNTTGLDAMDWRITDSRAAPQGALDALHNEKLLRLPDSQWCYRAPEPCPPVSPPPSLRHGMCTFAVFATAAKINDSMIELWSKIVRGVPASRLLVVLNNLASIPVDLRTRFFERGIDQGRVDFVPRQTFEGYLSLHGSADIVLDTSPFTGGTTTCHALWMGVPVVSYGAESATSRGGVSILHALGLAELSGDTADEYVGIAQALARDPDRLASLRSRMRDVMRSSPLMNAQRFTQDLENAYRKIWRAWCHGT